MNTDFMSEQEVMQEIGKARTALWRLRKCHGFPSPVLTHPARYSRKAVQRWIESGGINRAV
ncbi:helix-turn-helix transcriptional regulator [Pantoea sp. NPDC088449]|uniref:helix-turn-helix transcriptional regulator n=1 Tax=Pantoea sp. NPDC088449 TaxID=3364392 RepID=UPI00380A9BFD